ncbi:MAG: hypothetical protein H7069_11620 [Phormidesmis sp. FL-bin-119]|nr:hypothetical protein [Pedobacter sp.]
MRPQDIAILLKLIAIKEGQVGLIYLANSLSISTSEISESLNRSHYAGLLDDRRKVKRQNFMDFLQYGISHVFPQHPGTLVRGIATAHSHPYIKEQLLSNENYVWADINGDMIGLAIEPLYKKQVEAVKQDEVFYKLLALVDVLRVGRNREKAIAINHLKEIMDEPS